MKMRVLGMMWAFATVPALVTTAWAAPVQLDFLPPKIATKNICFAKRADSEIVDQWTKWDRKDLPATDAKLILRDALRLRDLDALKNFDIVERVLQLLPAVDAKQRPQSIAVERIRLFIAAGKIRQLKELGLVEHLLASQEALQPRTLATLADLYLTGLVVGQDKAKGLALLVSAASGGDPEALLRLAKLNLDGEAVEGWSLEPRLAVTLAFGALVGKLDPGICDRVGRIAREYEKGEVVAENQRISEQWYRFAADLGDPNAAWKVAGLHMESEDIEKDNDVLLRYLNEAADGGVTQAIVELGRIYDAGALVPGDPTKAEAYFDKAADMGSRAALVRHVLMMAKRSEDVTDRSRYNEVLRKLITLPNPPGWVYARLAQSLLDEKGRWAAEAEARPLIEKGVALGDTDADQLLAGFLLRERTKAGNFERAVELLTRVIESIGKIDPMTDLHDAYLCRAPGEANVRLAAYWHDSELRAGSATIALKPPALRALDEKRDAIMVATLQTQALYSRPKALASFLYYLKSHNADATELDFWQARMDKDLKARAAFQRLAYDDKPDLPAIERILDSFRAIADAGEVAVGMDIAQIVIENFPEDQAKIELAETYLHKAAAAGFGKALGMLGTIDRKSSVTQKQIFEQYADVIEARGDSDGLLFAAQVADDSSRKNEYVARAVSIMPCDYDNVVAVADSYAAIKDIGQVDHWLDLGEVLAADNAWKYLNVADRRLALQGSGVMPEAIALYTRAMNMGEDSAVGRLLKIYSDAQAPTYSPGDAAKMFKTLLASAKAQDIAGLLDRVKKSSPAIRNIVMDGLSVKGLYAKLADAGDPVAMRELGKLVRDEDSSMANAAASTDWFRKAANLGDTESMVELAKAYSLGIGVDPSLKDAAIWLKFASDKGNAEAAKLIATMKPVESATQ